MFRARRTGSILGTGIDVTTMHSTVERILELARVRRPAYVCFATAHMLVEAARRRAIHEAYAGADMVNPDGTPVAWCLRLLGHADADCVSGPRTVPLLLKEAAARGVAVGFYGGRPGTLTRMQEALERELPTLQIRYACSPPFRPLTREEQQDLLDPIVASGTELLFVGLGSPKQELWMRQWSASLPCVCLGVGAAFEFLSGEKKLPPLWLQNLGLTWLVRLCQEPRRLAVRNLYSPVFAAMFTAQRLFGARFARRFQAELPAPGTLAEGSPEA